MIDVRVVMSQVELEDKLVMASKAVAKKSVKPILSSFMFSLSDSFEVFATDLETGVRAVLNASEMEGEGKFAVEANAMLEIVKNLPDDTVEMELEGDNLILVSGKSRFKIATMDTSEFPEFVSVETESAIEVDTSILDDMIDKVIFAAATDEFMKNFNGVYWEFMENTLRLVASDGFRLALIDQPVESSVEMGFFISLKSMKELQNVVSNTSEPVLRLGFDGKRFAVKAGDVEVVMRVVDVDFPDYRRVLPSEHSLRVVVSRQEMLDSLKRVNVIAKRGSEAVRFEIQPGLLVMSSRSPDYGEVVEEIEADVEGEEMVIAFNPKFLTESLRRIDTPEVELLFVSQTAPLKMKPLDKEDYFYIIMPIRMA